MSIKKYASIQSIDAALGDFNLNLFWTIKGFKWRMIVIRKTLSFYFLENVWNVPFFEHMHSKFGNSANMTKKLYQSYCDVLKNVEFYADFKFVETGSKKVRNEFIRKKYVNL